MLDDALKRDSGQSKDVGWRRSNVQEEEPRNKKVSPDHSNSADYTYLSTEVSPPNSATALPFSENRFFKFRHVIAAIAIVNLILFMLPGHPTYYQAPSAILGILYATTMMVVINSHIVMSHHDSASDEPFSSMTNSGESRRPPFSALSGGISVMHEQWTVPALDVYNMHTCKHCH
jgi:hypothetical protein